MGNEVKKLFMRYGVAETNYVVGHLIIVSVHVASVKLFTGRCSAVSSPGKVTSQSHLILPSFSKRLRFSEYSMALDLYEHQFPIVM